MAGSDFINIELSAAGLKMVGPDGAVRVTMRHIDYTVKANEPARVLTSEWNRVLSLQQFEGEAIFQPTAPKAQETAVTTEAAQEGGR